MTIKLLTEHHLRFLHLRACCTGSSESTLVKMPHCWKSSVMAYNVSAGKKDNKEEEILSLEQFQELQDWCVDDVDVPKLPEPEIVCLTKGDNTEVIILHTG